MRMEITIQNIDWKTQTSILVKVEMLLLYKDIIPPTLGLEPGKFASNRGIVNALTRFGESVLGSTSNSDGIC